MKSIIKSKMLVGVFIAFSLSFAMVQSMTAQVRPNPSWTNEPTFRTNPDRFYQELAK